MPQRRIPTLDDSGRLYEKFVPNRLSDTQLVTRIQQVVGLSGTGGSSSDGSGGGGYISDGQVATYILTTDSQTRNALEALLQTLGTGTGGGYVDDDGVVIGNDEFIYVDDSKFQLDNADTALFDIDPDVAGDDFYSTAGSDADLIDVTETDVPTGGSSGGSSGGGLGNIAFDTDGTPYFTDAPVGGSTGGTGTGTTTPGVADPEEVRDIIGAALVAGGNVAIAVNDAANTITISVTGISSDAAPSVSSMRSLGTGSQQAAAGNDSRFTTLANRANHTGTQPMSSISGLQTALTTVPVLTLSASQVIPVGFPGYTLEVNASAAVTLTLDTDTNMPYDIGTVINVTQINSGTVTIGSASGVTLQTADTLTLRRQWSTATLRKRAANTWLVEGDLA